jgi:hypothetical protein
MHLEQEIWYKSATEKHVWRAKFYKARARPLSGITSSVSVEFVYLFGKSIVFGAKVKSWKIDEGIGAILSFE